MLDAAVDPADLLASSAEQRTALEDADRHLARTCAHSRRLPDRLRPVRRRNKG
jgi:hypothetical protein